MRETKLLDQAGSNACLAQAEGATDCATPCCGLMRGVTGCCRNYRISRIGTLQVRIISVVVEPMIRLRMREWP